MNLGANVRGDPRCLERKGAASNVGRREVRAVKWTENVEMKRLGLWPWSCISNMGKKDLSLESKREN